MTYCLSLDTSAHSASVAIADSSGVIGSLRSDQKQKHAEFINFAAEKLLFDLKLKLNSINVILLNRGPGSFTGLRVGIAFAKALSFSFGAKVLTMTTPELLAFEAGGVGDFVYKEDAQNSEYYFAVLKDLKFTVEPHLLRKSDQIPHLEQTSFISKGAEFNGARLLAELFIKNPAQFKTYDWKSLTPLYLKSSAAEELLILRK